MTNPLELWLFHTLTDDSGGSPAARRGSSRDGGALGRVRAGTDDLLALWHTGRTAAPEERIVIALGGGSSSRSHSSVLERNIALALPLPIAITETLRSAIDGGDRFLVGDDLDLMLASEEGDGKVGGDGEGAMDDEFERAIGAAARCFAVPALLLRAPTPSTDKVLCASWLLKKERGGTKKKRTTTWVWQFFRLIETASAAAEGAQARIEYSSHPWSASTFGRASSGVWELQLCRPPRSQDSSTTTITTTPATTMSRARGSSRKRTTSEKTTARQSAIAEAKLQKERKMRIKWEAERAAASVVSLALAPTGEDVATPTKCGGWARITLTANSKRPGDVRVLYAQSNAIALRWICALASCADVRGASVKPSTPAVSAATARGAKLKRRIRVGCAVRMEWRCFRNSTLEVRATPTRSSVGSLSRRRAVGRGSKNGSRRAALNEGYRINGWHDIGETIAGLQVQAGAVRAMHAHA